MTTGLLLLPGMDGTGELFGPFVEQQPQYLGAKIISYPPDRIMAYDELLPFIEQQVAPALRYSIIAESFSGPLAIEYAHHRSANVAAVVLCASFSSNPLPFGLRSLLRLACRPMFAAPAPTAVLRTLLLDSSAPASLVLDLKNAIRQVKPAVLAARMRAIASVDVSDKLRELKMPILYLEGSRDRLIGMRGAHQVRAAAPHAEVRVLDAPHLVLQTRPREAATAIMEFLESKHIY